MTNDMPVPIRHPATTSMICSPEDRPEMAPPKVLFKSQLGNNYKGYKLVYQLLSLQLT